MTLCVGTGEPNACGSGCEAGVGIYYSKNAGNSWVGPLGRESFNNRAVGSIAVKPGDSKTIFAASGRAVRGVSNVCCGGADALIPGAPHFGLYRSTNGGESWELVNQGAPALCTATPPDDGLARRHAVLAARRAARDDRPGRPEHRLRVVLRARHLAVERRTGTRHVDADLRARLGRRATTSEPSSTS